MNAANGQNMPSHDATSGPEETMSEATPKVALVTGSARGIGLATAKRFLADGWRVALLDIDNETLNRTHNSLTGSDVIAIHCDVADADGRRPRAGDRRGKIRPARCPGQQCRHCDL